MFCKNCGTQNPDNAVACIKCRAPLAVAPQQPVQPQPAQPQPVQPQPAQPIYQQPAQPVYQQPMQPQYQQPMYPGYPVPAPTVPGKGLGVASMVLGIISLVLFCIWYLAIPCAIIGAALGGIAMNKAKEVGMKNGLATAGLTCSCISLGVCLIYTLIFVIIIGESVAFLNSL